MANEGNLLKGEDIHKFTHEEASKGGKASAEARRRKRDIRNALEMLLEKDFTNKKGETFSGAEMIALRQFEKALKGDTRAFEVVRDTSGQSITQKIQLTEIDQDTIDAVEKMVLGYDDETGSH